MTEAELEAELGLAPGLDGSAAKGDAEGAEPEADKANNTEKPVKAELVKLRYFVGLSIDEAADLLRSSRTIAKRYWAFSRAWLLAEIDDGDF